MWKEIFLGNEVVPLFSLLCFQMSDCDLISDQRSCSISNSSFLHGNVGHRIRRNPKSEQLKKKSFLADNVQMITSSVLY